MATTNKDVRFGREWGECETCGRCWVDFRLRRHPRFGVQCIDCWDGGPHIDELDPPVHQNEATRRSDFPVCVAAEGIRTSAETLNGVTFPAETNIPFIWRDQSNPSAKFLVSVTSSGVTWTPTTSVQSVGGWNLDGLWSLYIANEHLTWTLGMKPGVIPRPSDKDVSVVGGMLVVNL